jgi:epoxyqueuosine reductase QueG
VRSIVVVARRLLRGAARIGRPDSRAAHYSAEIGISELEQQALEICLWLEDHGHPSIVLPATVSRSQQEDMASNGPLDIVKAAVEAGLGTLGLNGMLLTPEFGPRVTLGGVLTYAELEPDPRRLEALCRGESCGRCLSVCPGQAVRQWDLDVDACRRHSSPYGYWFLQEHMARIDAEPDPERKWELVRSTDTLMIWQSMLRGVGIITGCTRCQDVCPVGADFEEHLADALGEIPEETAVRNRAALEEIRRRAAAGDRGSRFEERKRWIGR